MWASNSAAHVSTVLNVTTTPAAARASRTAAGSTPSRRPSWWSENPRRLARRSPSPPIDVSGSGRDACASIARRSSTMLASPLRNHASMRVACPTSSTLTPRRKRTSRSKTRSGVAIATRSSSSSVDTASVLDSAASAFSPSRPCSRERSAFCRLSGKVRPIAITSPTDCIRVPSLGSAPGSFSNCQRGTLVTT